MKWGRSGPSAESTNAKSHVRVIQLDQTEAAQIEIRHRRLGGRARSGDPCAKAGTFLIANKECRRSSVGKLTGLLNTLPPISIILLILALVDCRFATGVAKRGATFRVNHGST